jgi:hypothetical protein
LLKAAKLEPEFRLPTLLFGEEFIIRRHVTHGSSVFRRTEAYDETATLRVTLTK